jgi:hypothetical protein
MRPAPEPVKLRIANVVRERASARQGLKPARHCDTLKNTAKPALIPLFMTPRRIRRLRYPAIDGNGSLPYKPRQLSAMARSDRGGSFGPGTACVLGQHFRTYLILRRILPGQRRTTREADLSTQQTGAQAPSRLSRAPRDRWRPQGSGGAPRARPQASERLSQGLPSQGISSWIG